MPLTFAQPGTENTIIKVTGLDDTRGFLANLGLVAGERVMVVSELAGNVIVNVKGSRIALDKGIANRVLV